MPAVPLTSPLRLAIGVALLALVGLLAVAAARSASPLRFRLRGAAEDLALVWTAGHAVAVPLLMAAGLAGLPLRGRPVALLLAGAAAATGAAAAVAARRRRRRPGDAPSTLEQAAAPAALPAAAPRPAPEPHRALLWAGRLTLAAALLLAVVKLALVPLWSWDHFAIWGLKARLLAVEGGLDLRILSRFDLVGTVPDYPLGVPLAWLAATLGGMPGEALVRGFHLSWLLALVALVHAAARRLSGNRLVALAAAAFVAVSPLAWDSVHLGLADLPLALFAAAAVATAAAALDGRTGEAAVQDPAPDRPPGAAAQPGSWLLAGLFVGFLPWVKSEGSSLAVLLALALVAWRWPAGRRGRARDVAALVLPAALVGGAAVAIGRLLLPQGVSFFAGDVASRLVRRVSAPREVLEPILGELVGRDWLGLWAALPIVLALAVLRRRVPALALAAVVLLQLAIYTAVFFATYLDVAQHVATALHRIAAALVPLAVLAAAALAAERQSAPRSSRRIPT